MILENKKHFIAIETLTSIFMAFVILIVVVSIMIFYAVTFNEIRDLREYNRILNYIEKKMSEINKFSATDEQILIEINSNNFDIKTLVSNPEGVNSGLKKYTISLRKKNNIKYKDITLFKRYQIEKN